MLAEMARAFNIGLGLGPNASTGVEESNLDGQRRSGESERRNDGGSGGSGDRNNENERSGGGGGERERERELPPEGSFERFLVELQTDLRVALSQDREDGEEEGEEERVGDGVDDVRRDGAGAGEESRRDVSREEEDVRTGNEEREAAPSVRSLVPTEPADSDEEDPDMPALQDVTDSDSDDDDEESQESVDDGMYTFQSNHEFNTHCLLRLFVYCNVTFTSPSFRRTFPHAINTRIRS